MSETNDDIPEKGTADAVTYIEVDTARVIAAFRNAADAVARFIDTYNSFAEASRGTAESLTSFHLPIFHPGLDHEFSAEDGECVLCGITTQDLDYAASLTEQDDTTS